MLGGIALVPADNYDGALIVSTAGKHAELIVKAARHDKRVFDILEKLMQSSDLMALVSFEGFFFYALLAHHNRINKNEVLLSQFGFSEEQVLNQFSQMVSNGNTAAAV